MFERSTIISSKVLNVLKKSKHPLSAANIMEKLKAQLLSPNKATIYRILKKLMEKNVISETILKNGIAYYENSNKSHHHHFFCNKCELVFCLDACHIHSQKINLDQLLPDKLFKIQSHDFNLYGICSSCSKS